MPATKEHELEILTGCLNSASAVRKAVERLDGYRFAERSAQWIWRATKETYSTLATIPTIKTLAFKAQNDIRNDTLFEEVVGLLRKISQRTPPVDFDAILPELIKAYNQQQILKTVDQLIDAAEQGNLDQAQGVLLKGSQAVNRRANRTGSSGLVSLARRALVEQQTSGSFTPTGLAWVDRRIRGIANGEVFLITGITGIGKSVSMIQAGQAAIGAGKRVLHLTTEMGKEQVAYRYLSRFTGIPEQRIRERKMGQDELTLLGAWLARNETRMNDLLKIEQIVPKAGTVADIQAALDELERDDQPAEVLIVDSPDHLRSLRQYRDARAESSEVWWSIKAIAERGYAIWATAQIARGKWEHRIATPEAVADNYDIARISDAFFSINWVLDERGNPTGKRRLYWGKYRSGQNRVVIPLKCDLEKMLILTAPEPEYEEGEPVD